MATIPTYQTRVGSLDVGAGVNLPPFDDTLARSIEKMGVSISQVADHIQARQQQKLTFSAEQSFLQFQNKMQEAYAQGQAQMPVAGEGWHDTWIGAGDRPGQFDKAANQFLATIPPDLRDRYAQKLETLKTDWSGKATVDQINERNKWFRGSLKDAAVDLELQIRRNGAVDFDKFRASGDTLINNSPLSPAEKQTLLQDWHANAAIARVQSLAAKDPQAAVDELHSWLTQQPTTVPSSSQRPLQQATADVIDAAAKAAGIPPATMRAYALIESGGNPSAGAGGKYQGLFQLGADEFAKGGGGNILDAADNARAAAVNLKAHIATFQAKFGRAPAPFELYLMHQQGEAGAFAHIANPSGMAWQNVRKFYGSDEVAKEAVWGNIPDDVKKQFPGGVESVSSADFMRLWASKVSRFGGGTSYLADLSPDQVDKLASSVQQQVNQQRTEDNRVAADGRADLTKHGDDLMHNMPGQSGYDPSRPTLTNDWLQANRENLSEGDYNRFLTALTPNEATIHTAPQELLRLDDLVEKDPRAALKEARDQFANRAITRGTYDQLVGRAQGIINGEEKRPYIGQIRSYLAQAIAPPSTAADNEYATALQQLFAFDDYAAKNKDATREEAQRQANTIISQHAAYRIQALRLTLPIPRFMDAPNRYVIGPDQLDEALTRTANAMVGGVLSPDEAAVEKKKIDAWREVVNARNQLPIQ